MRVAELSKIDLTALLPQRMFKQQLLRTRQADIPNNSDFSAESQNDPAPPVDSSSWFSNQVAVLKSSTVDFQEAQCFLMLACQAAAFATLRTQGEFLEAKSIQMLYNNFALLSLIAVGGTLPVTFVLFFQHTVGMRSLFNLTLSGITIFTSVAALFNVPEKTTQEFLQPLTDTSRLDKCGYNVPPVAYCVLPGGFDGVSELNRTLLLRQATAYCIFIYCGVLILHISALGLPYLLPRMTSKAKNSHSGASTAMETIDRYMPARWLSRAKFAAVLDLDIAFLVFLVQYLQRFSMLLEVGAIDTQAWGFGQIIAVTVWFQVLIKYGYWSICKYTPGNLRYVDGY